jgi:hypothetical protein
MTNEMWNFNKIDSNIQNENVQGIQHMVYVNTRARSSDSGKWESNRIGLKCESVTISTSKTVPALPIPGIGAVTGEAQTLALDLGMCNKTVQLGGIITDQFITKQFKQTFKNESRTVSNQLELEPSVFMTAHEVAQLLHSSVDSSAFQSTQNLNELIILIPSRVDHEYKYHTGLPERTLQDAGTAISEFTGIEDLPLIPFTYKVRSQDNAGSIYAIMPDDTTTGSAYSNFSTPIHNNREVQGMKGFIRSFSATFDANSAFVTFSLDFEVAFVVG